MVHSKINWEESSPIGSLRLNPWAKQRVREVSPNQLVAGRFFCWRYIIGDVPLDPFS